MTLSRVIIAFAALAAFSGALAEFSEVIEIDLSTYNTSEVRIEGVDPVEFEQAAKEVRIFRFLLNFK